MSDERRRKERIDVATHVKFVADDDRLLDGDGFDLSEIGIGFTTDEPITVSLVFSVEGFDFTRRAKLVRVTPTGDGSYEFGLEFVSAPGEESEAELEEALDK